MKKITRFILVFIVIFSASVYAQYEDFDLSKYKMPKVKRHYLRLLLNGNGGYLGNKEAHDTTAIDLYSRLSAQQNIDLDYSFYLNEEKSQRTIDINFRLNNRNSFTKEYRTDRTDRNTNDHYYDIDFYIQSINRNYLNQLFFIETDLVTRVSKNINSLTRTDLMCSPVSVDEYEYTENSCLTYIPLKFGFGRIERIDDARRAIYILQALKDVNKADRDLNEEEIIDFSAFISQLRNKRVFDSRLSHIETMESLDEYLRSRALISQVDATYYAHLDDMWRYGYNTVRNSGSRISFSVQPGFQNEVVNNSASSSYNYSDRDYMLDVGIDFKHDKPVNIYRQNKIEAYVYGGYNNNMFINLSDTLSETMNYINFRAGFGQTLEYYPNSRTEYYLNYGVNYANLFAAYDENMEFLNKGGHIINANISLGMEYYFSPKLSLNFSYRLNYAWNKSQVSVNANFGSQTSNNYTMGVSLRDYNEQDIYSSINLRIYYNIF
jgi:hypothetical protein